MSPRKKMLLLVVLLPAAALLALVMLLKCPPLAYHRTGAILQDPAARQEALRRFDEDVVNRFGDVAFDQSGRTRLNVTVTEDMVNARLRQYLDEADRNGERVPHELATLRVAFEPGCMVLAARIGRGATSVVAAQEIRLAATETGLLKVELGALQAGWLPIPRAVADQWRAGLRKMASRPEKAGDEGGADDLWRAVFEAMDQGPVPLGKGKRQIVLEKIEIERGSLHIEGHKATKRAAPR